LTAVGILAHECPARLERLVAALEPWRVILHVDAKSDVAAFRAILRRHEDRVTWVRTPVAVHWAGRSAVTAMLRVVDTALDNDLLGSREHLVFLSGACYPLKPIPMMERQLVATSGLQYCRAIPIASHSREHHWKVSRRHYWEWQGRATARGLDPLAARALRRVADASIGRLGRPVRASDDIFVGSQWVALTADFLSDCRAGLEEWHARLSAAFAPDEMVFHTTLHNSSWSTKTTALALPRMAVHPDMRPAELGNLHALHPSMNHTYGERDLPSLMSSEAFFVRKVPCPHEDSMIDLLDQARAHD